MPATPERVSLARKRTLIEEYRKIVARIAPERDRLKQIEAEIKAAMGDASSGTIGRDTVVTWATTFRETVNIPDLRAEQPEIARKYMRMTPVRTFKILPEPTR
jgi:predicted phage-related endonuclease